MSWQAVVQCIVCAHWVSIHFVVFIYKEMTSVPILFLCIIEEVFIKRTFTVYWTCCIKLCSHPEIISCVMLHMYSTLAIIIINIASGRGREERKCRPNKPHRHSSENWDSGFLYTCIITLPLDPTAGKWCNTSGMPPGASAVTVFRIRWWFHSHTKFESCFCMTGPKEYRIASLHNTNIVVTSTIHQLPMQSSHIVL